MLTDSLRNSHNRNAILSAILAGRPSLILCAMREFEYVAINKRGKSSSGKLLAQNSKEAKLKLQQDGLTPLKLKAGWKNFEMGNSNAARDAGKKKLKKSPIAKGSQKGERLGLEFLNDFMNCTAAVCLLPNQ